MILAAAVVVAVALWSVGWAVGKTSAMPDQIVIDAEEAIEFCAEALPFEVTSKVSYDELRRLLRLHLEWIQAYHWAPEGDSDGPILFEELDAVDYMVERADVVGLDITRDQVAAVVEVISVQPTSERRTALHSSGSAALAAPAVSNTAAQPAALHIALMFKNLPYFVSSYRCARGACKPL